MRASDLSQKHCSNWRGITRWLIVLGAVRYSLDGVVSLAGFVLTAAFFDAPIVSYRFLFWTAVFAGLAAPLLVASRALRLMRNDVVLASLLVFFLVQVLWRGAIWSFPGLIFPVASEVGDPSNSIRTALRLFDYVFVVFLAGTGGFLVYGAIVDGTRPVLDSPDGRR